MRLCVWRDCEEELAGLRTVAWKRWGISDQLRSAPLASCIVYLSDVGGVALPVALDMVLGKVGEVKPAELTQLRQVAQLARVLG